MRFLLGSHHPGCTTHRNCANCRVYAYAWHARIVATIPTPSRYTTPALFPMGEAA